MKKTTLYRIVRRWLTITAAGLLLWCGYLLWPRVVTGSLPVVVLPADSYQAGLEIGRKYKTAVHELAYDYYEKGLEAHTAGSDKAIARAVTRARASAPKNITDEIKGLADGSGVPEDLVWKCNLAVDIYSNSPLMACSAVVAPKKGGGFLVGRNLDFYDFDVLHKHTVLLVRPDGKSGWTASLAWPVLVGVITGWNDRGEFISLNLGINDPGRCTDRNSLPALFMLREFMELKSPRAEKLDWLKTQTVSFPMLLCFADRRGGAVIEKGSRGSRVRTRPDGAAFADNDEICWGAPMGGRCALLSKVATGHGSGVNRGNIEEALRKVTLGSVVLKSFCTLYSVVYDPATGEAWVAEGVLPATRGPYRRIIMPHYGN